MNKKCASLYLGEGMILFFAPHPRSDDNFSLGYNIFVGRIVVNSWDVLRKKVAVDVLFLWRQGFRVRSVSANTSV